LALAIVVVDSEQYGELALSEAGLADFAHVDEICILRRTFQKMGW